MLIMRRFLCQGQPEYRLKFVHLHKYKTVKLFILLASPPPNKKNPHEINSLGTVEKTLETSDQERINSPWIELQAFLLKTQQNKYHIRVYSLYAHQLYVCHLKVQISNLDTNRLDISMC